MLRCAKDLGLKARAHRTDWSRLARTPLPAIAALRDGGFLVVAKAAEDKVLVQSPLASRPALMTRDELLAVWDGGLILMTRRAGLSDITRRFDITWFLGAIHKYRHLLSEVLVASFFLQLFALMSPLFFQVVIDKVLVHRGLSTLDVLVIGLVAISIFENHSWGSCGPICSRTLPTALTSNLARACSTTCWLCRWPTSRRGASAIWWRGCANWRTSAIFSPARPDPRHRPVLHLCVPGGNVLLLAAADLDRARLVPFYIAISAGVTPLFRRRLDENSSAAPRTRPFWSRALPGSRRSRPWRSSRRCSAAGKNSSPVTWLRAWVLSLGNTASQVVQLVSKIVTAGILYFGAKLVIEGSLSVGELVAFNILAGRVSAPVLRLAQIWQDFHQARLSVARLGDILNTTAEPTYMPARARLPVIRGNIKFDHVTFRYRVDGQEVLHDVSFDVPAGQMVGIVGPSGSGKSTFAKLVQRLYVPESGRVLIDGMDLAMADPAWLRRQIGVVLQENVLFNRSVRENIALADPAMPMERVIAAASLAGSARIHPRVGGRLRHGRRRARLNPLGWPAPAHRHCPCARHRPAHSDLR